MSSTGVPLRGRLALVGEVGDLAVRVLGGHRVVL
jgi:hypothetical protein